MYHLYAIFDQLSVAFGRKILLKNVVTNISIKNHFKTNKIHSKSKKKMLLT